MAAYVKEKLPDVKVIFWDDMMRDMDTDALLSFVRSRQILHPRANEELDSCSSLLFYF